MATLRRKVFSIARKVVRHGRTVVLSTTRALTRQKVFESVLGQAKQISLAFG